MRKLTRVTGLVGLVLILSFALACEDKDAQRTATAERAELKRLRRTEAERARKKREAAERRKWKQVLDEQQNLPDGGSVSWSLKQPGFYRVRMTATNDGAGIEWVGAACSGVREKRVFTGECAAAQPIQLVAKNPTGFGLGASSIVAVHLDWRSENDTGERIK